MRATIALAALIRNRQRRLWNFCLALRQKQAVLTEIGSDHPFIHVSAMYGAERGGMAVVWPLGRMRDLLATLKELDAVVKRQGFAELDLAG